MNIHPGIHKTLTSPFQVLTFHRFNEYPHNECSKSQRLSSYHEIKCVLFHSMSFNVSNTLSCFINSQNCSSWMTSDIIKLYVSPCFKYLFVFLKALNLYNAPLFESEIAEKFLTLDNRMWALCDLISNGCRICLGLFLPFPQLSWKANGEVFIRQKGSIKRFLFSLCSIWEKMFYWTLIHLENLGF